MKKLKKISRKELKSIKGGEGFACYCDGRFSGYANTIEGCIYICDKKVIVPGDSSDSQV